LKSHDHQTITLSALGKAADTLVLVEASLTGTPAYDQDRTYTPKEREPFDALCDRFIRAVEVCIRFLRSYERLMFAENSDTYRDLLGRMEKLDLISSVLCWVDMREVRNRIVHDYLPNQIRKLYDEIMGPFGDELKRFSTMVPSLRSKIEQIGPDAENTDSELNS